MDFLVPWSARRDECLADTTDGAPDDWYRFLCVSLSHSLSELCAKNGQCLCARLNFNEGRKEVVMVGKEEAVGELELAEEVCPTINGRMENSHS